MFPSVLTTYTDPQPADRLNSPSHSGIERAQNTGLEQVEAVIGVAGANSVVGTFEYDVRSPASPGGGHIQGVAYGGTGQTNYAKGDLLIGQSASVLTKFAVSSVLGDVLQADPSAPLGIKWGNTVANKVAINTQTFSIYNSNAEQTIFATSVAGGSLSTNNAIKFKGAISRYSNAGSTFIVTGKYGPNTIFNIEMPAANVASSLIAFVEGTIVANNSSVLQKSFGEFYAINPGYEEKGGANVGITKHIGMNYGTASVNSGAEQNLIITGTFGTADVASCVLSQFIVVEKIT